jgi:hypothetical membrane protein
MDTTTLMLASGVVAAVLFTLVWMVEGARRPGYRPSYHPISALSLGPRGWIQVASFVTAGTLLGVFAVGVGRAAGGVVVPILLGVASLGLVGAGAFSMDAMRGYPPGAVDGDPPVHSAQHRRHDQASVAFFLAIPTAAFVAGVTGSGTWSWYSLATGVGTLGLLAWFASAYERDAAHAGLLQRTIVTAVWTWIALLGLRLL